jgi:glycosyltransferase involved in cell wall biosynthesis
MPKVSVVLPTYDAARFVGEAVESVLLQTFSDFELIVVDDGSTDETREIVAGYSDPRVRYIYQENRGPAAARNAGIRASRGEYVVFLDADDTWLPRKLACQIPLLRAHPDLGLVYCSAYKFEDDAVFSEMRARHRGDVVYPLLIVDNIVAGSASSAMVRRECFDRVGLFDEDLTAFEDWDMWLRIALQYEFDYVPEHLVMIRVHSASIQKQVQRMKTGILAFFDKVLTDPTLAAAARPVRRRVRSLACFVLGRACCNGGELGLARRYLLQSVWHYPLQGRAWALLAVTLLGPRPMSWARAGRTRLIRAVRYRHLDRGAGWVDR